MVLPAWPLLYLLPIQLIWAGPLSTESLTPRLAEVIPTCAQTCVESFVAENYQTVCGPPPNFECLCVNTTPSGFTIGEGSLECLVSSCEDYTEKQAVDIYEACVGVPDARPNTHAILTASATSVVSQTIATLYPTQANGNIASSTSYISSSISSTPASSTAFGGNSARTTTTSPSVRSSISSLKSDITTPTTTPTATAESSTSSTKATAAPAATHILTKPQIAGIAVASIGATALALGLCFIFLFFRRKRLQKRYTASSFGGGKIMDSSLESTPDLAANSMGDFERHDQPREGLPPPMPRGPLRLVTPATSSEDGWNHYQRSMNTEDIGLAVGPPLRNSTAGPSPKSPTSNRTTDSHLLPDKPHYSLFPSPLKINARNSIPGQGVRPPRVDTSNSARPPSTGPPHQFPNSMDNTSQSNLQRRADPHRSLTQSDPFFSSSSPPDIDPFIQANGPVVHPGFRVPPQLSPTDVARWLVPAHQSPSARGLFTSSNRTVPPNLPQNFSPSGLVEQHSRDPTNNSYRRKHHPNRKSESSRPLTTFLSEDSDTTSIEEDSDDEPEIRPRSTLSPVAESPHLRSPFQQQKHQFEYPPVPVSTSASPMRYPTRVEQRSQPQPLSTRRLGEQRAREIAGRLETQAPPSAKWKVLVSPGLEPLGNSESPASPSASEAGRTQSRGFPQRR